MSQPANRLVNILIGKSIAETVLVGTLAVVCFIQAFPPFYHGWGEATSRSISGWVVDDSAPWDRVEVQLFIDGVFVAVGVANKSRSDLVAAGWARDEWHGYEFPLSVILPGDHEARVYAVHATSGLRRRTLQLIGDPIRFRRNQDGTLTWLK